ncbi:MAG: GntR family transcriptional regulator [Alphaproteobacteria bacterium]|nr:GntR family transcriptional regulator [Alphaproteobacteria bacterium]
MSNAKLVPVRHEVETLRTKIISHLRRAIEAGILEPGMRLVEKDLCEQLQVSRTSLREALRELQAEGVLTYVSNRGLTVATVTRGEVENIYRIRKVLEPLLVEQFIEKASRLDIQALKASSRKLKAAYKSGDFTVITAAKRDFYDRICIGADNAIAFDILNRLTLRTSQLRRKSVARRERQEESVREIDALVRAIDARDVEAARKTAETHVANAARSAFLASPELSP